MRKEVITIMSFHTAGRNYWYIFELHLCIAPVNVEAKKKKQKKKKKKKNRGFCHLYFSISPSARGNSCFFHAPYIS